MINIISLSFKTQFKSVILYLIGLIGYAWTMIGFFPSMQENMNLEEYLKNLPKQFVQIFSGGEAVSMSKIEGFISMEYLSLFFILIIVLYIASSAGSAIAGAIEKKTIDFTLSQPLPRVNLVLAEALPVLIYIFALVAMTSFSIWLLCGAYDLDIKAKGLLAFTLVATIFLWAFYGIAIFLSSFLKSKMSVVALTSFIVVTLYVLNSLSQVVDKLKGIDQYTLFNMYKPQNLLTDGTIDGYHILTLLLIFTAGLTATMYIFEKRDL